METRVEQMPSPCHQPLFLKAGYHNFFLAIPLLTFHELGSCICLPTLFPLPSKPLLLPPSLTIPFILPQQDLKNPHSTFSQHTTPIVIPNNNLEDPNAST